MFKIPLQFLQRINKFMCLMGMSHFLYSKEEVSHTRGSTINVLDGYESFFVQQGKCQSHNGIHYQCSCMKWTLCPWYLLWITNTNWQRCGMHPLSEVWTHYMNSSACLKSEDLPLVTLFFSLQKVFWWLMINKLETTQWARMPVLKLWQSSGECLCWNSDKAVDFWTWVSDYDSLKPHSQHLLNLFSFDGLCSRIYVQHVLLIVNLCFTAWMGYLFSTS